MRSEDIGPYEGTFFWDAGKPVGYLEVVARREMAVGPRTFPCTAWLVGPDVIMTAWHCLPGLPKELRDTGWRYVTASVTFGFDEIESPGTRYTVGQVFESSQELDYALARLLLSPGQPPPGEAFGVIRVAKGLDPLPGTPLFMIHHAYGYSKLLLKDRECNVFDPPSGLDHFLYHRCDTRGGSSGAPVLLYERGSEEAASPAFLAVGLHSTGAPRGLANATDYNISVSLAAIIERSRYLSAVACEPDFLAPYCEPIDSVAPAQRLVYFDFDRTDLNPAAQETLRRLVDEIKADSRVNRLLVVGHTDPNEGSAAYGIGVSNRRARTVADVLVSMGINGGIISLDGRGETQPLVDGLQLAYGLNRRVEIIVGYESDADAE